MNTYYNPGEESKLHELVQYVKKSLTPEQWSAAHPLEVYASMRAESPLRHRFHDASFLEVPAAALMLSEALYAAQRKGWLFDKAEDNDDYRAFIESTWRGLCALSDLSASTYQQMMKEDVRIRESSMKLVPAFHLRHSSLSHEAYFSYQNTVHTYQSGRTNVSKWEHLVLDRGNSFCFDLALSLFYNTGFDRDLRTRQEFKRFLA